MQIPAERCCCRGHGALLCRWSAFSQNERPRRRQQARALRDSRPRCSRARPRRFGPKPVPGAPCRDRRDTGHGGCRWGRSGNRRRGRYTPGCRGLRSCAQPDRCEPRRCGEQSGTGRCYVPHAGLRSRLCLHGSRQQPEKWLSAWRAAQPSWAECSRSQRRRGVGVFGDLWGQSQRDDD